MKKPPIQFASSRGGASIAFWMIGSGTPLVVLHPFGFSHIDMEWQIEHYRQGYERLANSHLLVRVDIRNHGMSTRGLEVDNLDDFVSDILAVVNRSGSREVSIFAAIDAAKIAVDFAARYPERVSSLILYIPNLGTGNSHTRDGFMEIFHEAAAIDWRSFTDALAALVVGVDSGDLIGKIARYIRSSVSARDYLRMRTILARVDATPRLSDVRCPTLFLVPVPPSDARRPYSTNRAITWVASLPTASFRLVDVKSPLETDPAVVNCIEEFLSGGTVLGGVAAVPDVPRTPRGPLELSETERAVMELLLAGASNARVREHLGLSKSLLENTLADLYEHLGVDTALRTVSRRAAAVAAYARLSEPPDTRRR